MIEIEIDRARLPYCRNHRFSTLKGDRRIEGLRRVAVQSLSEKNPKKCQQKNSKACGNDRIEKQDARRSMTKQDGRTL